MLQERSALSKRWGALLIFAISSKTRSKYVHERQWIEFAKPDQLADWRRCVALHRCSTAVLSDAQVAELGDSPGKYLRASFVEGPLTNGGEALNDNFAKCITLPWSEERQLCARNVGAGTEMTQSLAGVVFVHFSNKFGRGRRR